MCATVAPGEILATWESYLRSSFESGFGVDDERTPLQALKDFRDLLKLLPDQSDTADALKRQILKSSSKYFESLGKNSSMLVKMLEGKVQRPVDILAHWHQENCYEAKWDPGQDWYEGAYPPPFSSDPWVRSR